MTPAAPRWRRRHENFGRAANALDEAVKLRASRALSDLEEAGLVERFEVAWELGWKLLADCLRELGREPPVVGPKPVIREAFVAGLIADGQVWIDATNTRNLMSHLYDKQKIGREIEAVAARYLAAFQTLHDKLADGTWLGPAA